MRLKVNKLPKNNKSALLIQVDYDQNDEGACRETYCESYEQGASFEVDDEIAYLILTKYKGVVSRDDRPAAPKDGVPAGIRTKEQIAAPRVG